MHRPFLRLTVLAFTFAAPLAAQSVAPAPALVRDEVVNLDKFEVAEATAAYSSPLTLAKGAQSIRTLPQSASVLTRQRLDDQNLTAIADVLKQATGVTVQRFDGAGHFNNYYARGYQIDSLQLDGLAFGNTGNVTEFDAAVYDRVEILRGPAGLFQGAGEPGAALNLARKRARSRAQFSAAATLASASARRLELDATGPLLASGALRARAVLVADDRDSFVDVLTSRRRVAYGTVEYDFSSATTVSLGVARQEIDSVIDQGLPAYADGRLLDVPASTFIGARWNKLDTDATDLFLELEHRLSGGGFLKFASRRLDRYMLYKVARANGAVTATGDVPMQTGIYTPDRENRSYDAYASLPFTLAGRTHHLIFGADRREAQEVNLSTTFANTTTQNVFAPNHDLPQPAFSWTSSGSSDVRQTGAYAQVRASLAPVVTAIAGGRLTWWRSISRNRFTGTVTSDFEARGEFTPFAAVLVDFNRHVTAYASYSDIFQPQSARRVTGEQLEPRTGLQYETGLKAEFPSGRLAAQTALFRIQDQNRALSDPANPLFSLSAGEVRSQGFEFELTGRPLPSWDVSLGYTLAETEYLRAAAAQQGQVFAPFTPRHSVKLWTRYAFTTGALDGLSLGGGVSAVSSFYSQSGTVRFVADAVTLVTAQLGYRFNRHWSANLTVTNLFDEIYYEKVSAAGRQNFYGAPRQLALAVRTQW